MFANNSFNRHVDGRGITDSYIIAKGIKFFFSELSTLANMKMYYFVWYRMTMKKDDNCVTLFVSIVISSRESGG